MNEIKVKAPAKINLTLEVLNRREDGYHEIRSIMQTVNLYDYLTFSTEDAEGIQIELYGNTDEIPYNEKNLVYKAAVKYFETAEISDVKLKCYIAKNIPVAAGLAGGSTDAAATLYALNKLFNEKLTEYEIENICSNIGSDVLFCYKGGCAICTSRGEKIRPIPYYETPVSLVKIKNLKISAKEAYDAYDLSERKEYRNYTAEQVKNLLTGDFDISLLHNDLEQPMLDKYHSMNNIKTFIQNSLMSGSGPVFFVLTNHFDIKFEPDEFWYVEYLQTIGTGVEEYQ